jgi:hypothetical protein
VDETLSAHRLPEESPDNTPAKLTRNTAGVPTDLTLGESREYPEIPGTRSSGSAATAVWASSTGHGSRGPTEKC